MSDSKRKPRARLHHVGIAVNGLEDTMQALGGILGIGFEAPETVEAQKVRVVYSTDPSAKLELIEATAGSSPLYPILPHPIRSFIEKHGQGLHHLCFEVRDLDGLLSDLDAAGVTTVGGILEGSHDGKVAFLNPEHCMDLLIELRECADD